MLNEISEEDIDFFAKECARKVCGDTHLNVVAICTGQTGSGKSFNLISLSQKTAHYISKKLNKPESEIFNFDENVGIMTWEGDHGIEKVINKMDMCDHQVFILDDFGTAYKTLQVNV